MERSTACEQDTSLEQNSLGQPQALFWGWMLLILLTARLLQLHVLECCQAGTLSCSAWPATAIDECFPANADVLVSAITHERWKEGRK